MLNMFHIEHTLLSEFNNLVICFGHKTPTTASTVTTEITLPYTYKNVLYPIAIPMGTTARTYMFRISAKTLSTFTISCHSGTNTGVSSNVTGLVDIYYIGIGY